MNGLIHMVLRRSKSNDIEQIKHNLLSSLRIHLNQKHTRQLQSVHYYFDGPGTRSKMVLQRKRRSKAVPEEKIDAIHATPGTDFMGHLKQAVSGFAQDLLKETQSTIDEIYLSGSDRWGEGEYKIFEYINGKQWDKSEVLSIMTCDSDTILFALLSDANIKLFNILGTQMKDINELKFRITSRVPHRTPKQVLTDFVFLNLFRGNDLLPSLGRFEFHSVWRAYTNSTSTEGIYNAEQSQIHWPLLLDVLSKNQFAGATPAKITARIEFKNILSSLNRFLGRVEDRRITCHEVSIIDPNTGKSETILAMDGRKIGPFSVGKQGGSVSEDEPYKELLNPDHQFWTHYKDQLSPEQWRRIEDMCITASKQLYTRQQELPSIEHFLEGVIWQMDYLRGKCTHFGYHYRFFSTPDITDINQCTIPPNSIKSDPLPPLQFCLALTHPINKYLVNDSLHSLFDELPHFDTASHIQINAWKQENALKSISESFNKVLDRSKLSPMELDHLRFNPTLWYKRDGESIYLQEEVLNVDKTHTYTEPKLIGKTNNNSSTRNVTVVTKLQSSQQQAAPYRPRSQMMSNNNAQYRPATSSKHSSATFQHGKHVSSSWTPHLNTTTTTTTTTTATTNSNGSRNFNTLKPFNHVSPPSRNLTRNISNQLLWFLRK
ncbi:hypothetical protein SAMD00019534_125880 [Acytostelium subglobosum LB1]|uniref:hypothetical protein n=1 Tax=Acytostelium subglobosum LB1 TaxID=1410327 RepID=UPI0006448214|nr:hypothetical protein SAMD00019534_125880 [Acytostelium subglobosum LB1]GAM29412.1 hypothetical protein SAMD00019534_125880 [Acytostelium subglobosum LB1]|eukprot:XP_012747638.1 hypothetical protein SAMD00019534_125880 [Acytostelium subglobosum LB1]